MTSQSEVITLLIAHGSRIEAANKEVAALAKILESQVQHPVIACFLEIAKPSIPEGLELAIQQTPQKILVLPYFLTQGRHVKEDIPKIIQEKSQAHPQVKISLLDYLGTQKSLVDLLAKMVK